MAACLVVVGSLVLVTAAGGHPIPPGYDPLIPSPINITVDSIEPNVSPDALVFEAIGGLAELSLTGKAGHDVVVLGYDGEPFLHVDANGHTFSNANSPSTYINSTTTGGDSIPPAATRDAPVDWQPLPTNGTVTWHDHRAHWMTPGPPPTAAGSDVVQPIEVHLVVDGRPVKVNATMHLDASVPWSNYQIALGAAGTNGTATAATGGLSWPWIVLAAVVVVAGAATGVRIVRNAPHRPQR